VAAVLLGLVLAGAAQAQESLLIQLSKSDSSWLHFGMINGRVSLRCARMGGLETSNSSKERKETLNIQDENNQSKLNYELTTDNERFTLTAVASVNNVVIRREPRGKAAFVPVEFTQAPNEKTTLTLGAGPEKRTYQASDIWRLAIARPKECKEHLFPLLEMIRSGWKFSETAAGVEEKLLQEAGKDAAVDRARWAKMVEQLGDERFAKREAANRSLRAEGIAAVGYLRQLDFSKLDAEQQFRVRKILDAFTGLNGDDSIEEIAASLAADPMVWLELLSRPESATRKAAAKQLAMLLGEPIDVDPAADPDSQKEKREQLKARIEAK
jgi:hypothetical protein